MRIVISFADGTDAIYHINPEGLFSWKNVEEKPIIGLVTMPLEAA